MTSYEYYKKIGICPGCKEMKPATGRVYCPNCIDQQALLHMIRRDHMSEDEHEESKKKMRENNKSRYERLKAEGICPQCGKRKARPGMVFCAYCGGKQAAQKKIYYRQRKERDKDADSD